MTLRRKLEPGWQSNDSEQKTEPYRCLIRVLFGVYSVSSPYLVRNYPVTHGRCNAKVLVRRKRCNSTPRCSL